MRAMLGLIGDTRRIRCGQRSSPPRLITARAWRTYSQRLGMQIRQRQNFMIGGGIIQRSRQASLRIIDAERKRDKPGQRRLCWLMRGVHSSTLREEGAPEACP